MRLGCDHKFAVLEALGSEQAVTESSDLFALAPQDNHFQTEMGIQVLCSIETPKRSSLADVSTQIPLISRIEIF